MYHQCAEECETFAKKGIHDDARHREWMVGYLEVIHLNRYWDRRGWPRFVSILVRTESVGYAEQRTIADTSRGGNSYPGARRRGKKTMH
jgi:hypothetical protein